jgi:hypothetical protein
MGKTSGRAVAQVLGAALLGSLLTLLAQHVSSAPKIVKAQANEPGPLIALRVLGGAPTPPPKQSGGQAATYNSFCILSSTHETDGTPVKITDSSVNMTVGGGSPQSGILVSTTGGTPLLVLYDNESLSYALKPPGGSNDPFGGC